MQVKGGEGGRRGATVWTVRVEAVLLRSGKEKDQSESLQGPSHGNCTTEWVAHRSRIAASRSSFAMGTTSAKGEAAGEERRRTPTHGKAVASARMRFIPSFFSSRFCVFSFEEEEEATRCSEGRYVEKTDERVSVVQRKRTTDGSGGDAAKDDGGEGEEAHADHIESNRDAEEDEKENAPGTAM